MANKDDATWLRVGSNGGIAFWGDASNAGESGTNYAAFINYYGLSVSANHGGSAQCWSGVNLYVSGNGWITGTWTVGSDKRFKKNIAPIESALEKVLKLNGKSYEFNKEEYKDYNLNSGKNIGFLAQEVNEVLPEVVSIDNKGYYGINYIAIIPVLTEAIKEQNKKIMDLEKQLSYCCSNTSVHSDVTKNPVTIEGNGSEITNNKTPRLFQNNPNPFNKQTSISYYLSNETKSASLLIMDMQGKLIKTIAVTNLGNGSLTLTANELTAGMYMYSLIADGKEIDTKRMLLTE